MGTNSEAVDEMLGANKKEKKKFGQHSYFAGVGGNRAHFDER